MRLENISFLAAKPSLWRDNLGGDAATIRMAIWRRGVKMIVAG
jgi:hypothetical protein